MDHVATDNGNPAAPKPRSVAADRGLAWWTEAWALFMRRPLLWVGLGVILLVGTIVVSMVPLLGGLAVSLLTPVLIGGWLLAARKVEQGGTLEVADLLAGFQGERLTPLIVLGALLLAAMVAIGLVAGVLGMGALWGLFAGGMNNSPGGMMAAMGTGLVGMALAMLLLAAVSMALWFAPALVVFRQVPPVDAIKLSANAMLKNIVPFLVYGVISIVAAIVASIPFGLGWIVLVPLGLLTAYVSYRDVFEG